MEEKELLLGLEPTEEEKQLLDKALSEFEHDGDPGTPWKDVLQTLRSERPA